MYVISSVYSLILSALNVWLAHLNRGRCVVHAHNFVCNAVLASVVVNVRMDIHSIYNIINVSHILEPQPQQQQQHQWVVISVIHLEIVDLIHLIVDSAHLDRTRVHLDHSLPLPTLLPVLLQEIQQPPH